MPAAYGFPAVYRHNLAGYLDVFHHIDVEPAFRFEEPAKGLLVGYRRRVGPVLSIVLRCGVVIGIGRGAACIVILFAAPVVRRHIRFLGSIARFLGIFFRLRLRVAAG